ncbi:MAG: hypothetical protein M5U32_17145 [Myxococcota bacterium]|nr:hypothetical protein [Myxococcota bacterium]
MQCVGLDGLTPGRTGCAPAGRRIETSWSHRKSSTPDRPAEPGRTDFPTRWREILGSHDPEPRGPDERPVDVREWDATTQAIGASAAELGGLAAELQGFSGSAGVDRLLWRAVVLRVLFFALLSGSRVLAARRVHHG